MKNKNTKYNCINCKKGTNTIYSGKCEKCEFYEEEKIRNKKNTGRIMARM